MAPFPALIVLPKKAEPVKADAFAALAEPTRLALLLRERKAGAPDVLAARALCGFAMADKIDARQHGDFTRISLALRSRWDSLRGRHFVMRQYGPHGIKDAVAPDQRVEQRRSDVQKNHRKKEEGEIEMRVPQRRVQTGA